MTATVAVEALGLVRKAGLDPDRVREVLGQSAGTSRMLRGPMMVRGEFPPQMKL